MTGELVDLWSTFDLLATGGTAEPALVFPDKTVTRGALRAAAVAAAARLAAMGVGRGDVVALHLPKRPDTYALWLACLRSRAPYVFLDPRNPPVRSLSILDRVRPKLLVTADAVENAFGHTLRLDTAEAGERWLAERDAIPGSPPARGHVGDPAYIMFTSGSTGEPKGAVISQAGVLGLMNWARTLVDVSAGVRFSNINPLHFDNSVFDLYGGLLNGAALLPIETGAAVNPANWVRRLREGRVNVVFGVPTLFQTLDRLGLLDPEHLPGVELFVFGGEGFPIAPLRSFHQRFAGRAKLLNVYGPTETSCICSSLSINRAELDAAGEGLPSLGRMHPEFEHTILDAAGMPVSRGEPGELWIGGPFVGLGYYRHPEETARRFRQDPRQSAYRSIWYRSGDLVREDAIGQLWFHGRADNQVKVRGHRVELEEIDLVIESIAAVSRAIAVAMSGRDGDEIRVAYVAGSLLAADVLAAHCADRLPAYMRPTRFVQLEDMPCNANGKADRKAVAGLLTTAEP